MNYEVLGIYGFSKIYRSSVVSSALVHFLKNERQDALLSIPYYKEGSTVLGRLLSSVGNTFYI